MFSSLAARETLRTQILLQERAKMFLNQVKNIFASRTQILLPKQMFPSLTKPLSLLMGIVKKISYKPKVQNFNIMRQKHGWDRGIIMITSFSNEWIFIYILYFF